MGFIQSVQCDVCGRIKNPPDAKETWYLYQITQWNKNCDQFTTRKFDRFEDEGTSLPLACSVSCLNNVFVVFVKATEKEPKK